MSTWKCQCFTQIAREPSNIVKAREQSKKPNYTDQFKIDHYYNPARDFSLASKFYMCRTCACSSISVDDFVWNSVSVSRTRIQQKSNWRWRLNYNYYCFSWLNFLVLNNKIINWPVIENSRERCDVKNIIPHCKHQIGQLNTLCIS